MSTKTIASDTPTKAGAGLFKAAGLPVTRDLTPVLVSSLLLAAIMALTSLAGLLYRGAIYPSEEVLLAFLPVDPFNLVVELPVLLLSIWLARRGKLIGLLCWPGALFYLVYTYLTNLIGVPFGVLFLPYLTLVVVSAYTTIALVASIDHRAVRQQLAGAVPERAAGGYLLAITGLFVVTLVSGIMTALAEGRPAGSMEIVLWIADSALSPAMLVGGVLLWRRSALGYAAAVGMLLVYGLLFAGLLLAIAFPALYAGLPIDTAGFVIILVMLLPCLVLLALFVRGALSDRTVQPLPRLQRHADA